MNSRTKIGNLSLLPGIITILACATIPNVFAQPADQTWKLFTDPENEFSIEYPSSWDAKPAENRFERADVNIYSSEGPLGGFAQVQYQYNIMSEELTENNLELYFPSIISGISTAFDSFNQVEEALYDKYKIDGHKAASVVASFETSGMDFAGLLVASPVGNKLFVFNYSADPNRFDANFPIAEHMLNSTKILDEK